MSTLTAGTADTLSFATPKRAGLFLSNGSHLMTAN
uniref:Uncharacterized protein n=1 Tax=Anguilla anguilla TaxID=7936 RepID=A0A0E9U0J2_ANGAN